MGFLSVIIDNSSQLDSFPISPMTSMKTTATLATMSRSAEVDQYIAAFPPETADILNRVRDAIHAGIPDGEERIGYKMPAVALGDRDALYFAGWKKHVGLYPVPHSTEPIEAGIAPYRAAKDSVNFLYASDIPYDLITRIAAYALARATA